jgi:hypothetical protein
MGFFDPKPPVDALEVEWLLACFAWLDRGLAAAPASPDSVRQLATPDTASIANVGNASELFEAVKTLAGLKEWHCVLEPGEAPREHVLPGGLGEYSTRHALGTFSVEGNVPVIRYDPTLLGNPSALVATLAHELAHLLTATLDDPPGGDKLHEHATDCAAVYLGFGVFLANSARQFEQFQDAWVQGWRSSTSGYLSETALVTATAMFVRLFAIDPDLARAPLKPYLQKDFAKALKYIDWRYPEIAGDLADVDLSVWGS